MALQEVFNVPWCYDLTIYHLIISLLQRTHFLTFSLQHGMHHGYMKLLWEMPHRHKSSSVQQQQEHCRISVLLHSVAVWRTVHVNAVWFMQISFHFCTPLSLSSDTTTAGYEQLWFYVDLLLILTEKSSYGNDLWSRIVWSALNWYRRNRVRVDTDVNPWVSAELSKHLCKLLSFVVTCHLTHC